MARPWTVLVGAFFLLNNAVCVLGEDSRGRVSSLGDSVILSAGQNCRDGKELKLTRLLKNGSTKAVGAFVKGVWVPEEEYKDRLKHHSNISVVLSNVTYNDKGVYEFTCADNFDIMQLDVVVPCAVPVTEGQTVKLPYYIVTVDNPDVESIRWEKNEKLVFELNLTSEGVRYGTGLEERVSLSPDWYSRGDLSLKLERAQPQDEGDFFIYQRGRIKTGDPAAVRLKFKKRNSDQISCTPPPGSPPQSATGEKAMGTCTAVYITAAVMLVVVALLAGWFGWWLKSR